MLKSDGFSRPGMPNTPGLLLSRMLLHDVLLLLLRLPSDGVLLMHWHTETLGVGDALFGREYFNDFNRV